MQIQLGAGMLRLSAVWLLAIVLSCHGARFTSKNLREGEEFLGWLRRSGTKEGPPLHYAARRADYFEIDIPIEVLDEDSSGPDLALKSNSGEFLGYSVSASGRALQLSFTGNAIMSAHANRGGFFYEANYGLLDHVIPPRQVAKGTVSDGLACFVQERANSVACYVLQEDVLDEIELRMDLSLGDVWLGAGEMSDASCNGAITEESDDNVCRFGDGIGAWGRAVAVSGGFPNSRFVETWYMAPDGAGGFAPMCTNCDRTTNGNLTSSIPSFGNAVALGERVLAVGAPPGEGTGQAGMGRVSVFAAVGAEDGSGYGRHRNWVLRRVLGEEGNFGAAVSVGPEFMAVGAPGNMTYPAKLHVYRLTGEGAGLAVREFCVVSHPEPWTYRSGMGSALDQMTDGVYTWVVAGAPGGNVAYTVLLRAAQPGALGGAVCEYGDTLVPPLLDFTRADQFGFSVAATARQHVFVGAPYYSRWYRQEMSGLVYALAYCFPGSRIRTQGGLRSCVACELGMNSVGGVSEGCFPCADPIPGNSTFVFGCNYQCNAGYVYPDCVICSEAKAKDPAAVLPANAHWKDYAPTCELECDGGFYLNLTTRQHCEACPQFSRDILEEQPNREWVLGEECTTRCKSGFFEDVNDVCMLCSQQNANANNPPPAPNSEWVDGLAVCDWVPLPGFRADRANLNVSACPAKPRNSQWKVGAPALVDARCEFECDAGFFGPTLGFPAVCERCSVLLSQFAGFALPNNASWADSAPECSRGSAFVCDAGFTKSNFTHFCCPATMNNSRPDPAYSPCGVVCLEGFYWDNATATCKTCAGPLLNARWKIDCDFECDEEHFGREDFGECLLCTDFAARKRWAAPFNAWYPQQQVRCGVDDWNCLQGVASLNAEPPGCCPLRSGIPLDDATFDLTRTGEAGTCGYACRAGFVWNAVAKNCSACASVADQVQPPNSEWNYVGLCYYRCKPGFVHLPTNETVPTACVDCAAYAQQQGWALPSNASWKASGALAAEEECTPESWDCISGMVKNPEAGLCCVASQLPDTESERGGWASGSCEWRCGRGYFPQVPTPEDSPPCVTCRTYLERFCAENAECELNDCANDISNHCFDDLAPDHCDFALFLELVVQGVSRTNLTAQPSTRQIRRELAALVPGVAETQVSIVAVRRYSEEEAARRAAHPAAARELLQAGEGVGQRHLLRLHFAGVDPPALTAVSNTLRSRAGPATGSALNAVGVAGRATLLGGLEVRPSHEAVRCDEGYAMNPETRTCCLREFFNDPQNIDPARYTWQDNGCAFDCLPSLIGPKCLTCTQFSENKFKPENSIWDDSSPNCTWMCRTGYVKSSTGYECRSIKNLASLCSENKRCATCVAHENNDLCVWCNGECVPGEHRNLPGGGVGCPFLAGGEVGGCTCDSQTCKEECQYDNCGDCVQDAFCGWCGATQTCMLGSYFSPLSGTCPGEWSTGINTRCTEQTGIWLVGLVCASVSTLLVGLMCCYFVLRVRAAQRSQQAGLERFGAQPAGVTANRAQELTERFLATFPTFKYSALKAPVEREPKPERDDDEESEEEENFDDPCCSICLGNFVNGEECRMLPCLHVFHRACIDQWLTVSVECPLCKRSVLGAGADQPSAAFMEAQRRYNSAENSGTVTGDVSFQMAIINQGAPNGPAAADGANGAGEQRREGEVAV